MIKNIIIFFVVFFIFVGLIIYLTMPKKNNKMIFGTTFSHVYAKSLGLDYKKVYQSVIGELGFKYVRLMAPWDKVEAKKGMYDFRDIDYLMDQSAAKGVKVVLAVGRKTPRWPECHIPSWASEMKYDQYRSDLHKYIEAVVNRYKNHPALEYWQVENEPFLRFGKCSSLPRKDLKVEIDFVKKLDSKHKVIVTDSGELSTWRKTATVGDLFGTTMYKVVWNKWTGYWKYDWLPSSFYPLKLSIFGRDINEAFVIELQAEPWLSTDLDKMSDEEIEKSMSIKRLKKHIDYAQQTGMPRAYLWGVEWWYWLQEKKNNGSYLEYVKTLKLK